jgi:hypothetical protein
MLLLPRQRASKRPEIVDRRRQMERYQQRASGGGYHDPSDFYRTDEWEPHTMQAYGAARSVPCFPPNAVATLARRGSIRMGCKPVGGVRCAAAVAERFSQGCRLAAPGCCLGRELLATPLPPAPHRQPHRTHGCGQGSSCSSLTMPEEHPRYSQGAWLP